MSKRRVARCEAPGCPRVRPPGEPYFARRPEWRCPEHEYSDLTDLTDDRTEAEKRYDAERAHRPIKKNPDDGGAVQLLALCGAAAAGYFLLYKPWAQRRALEELTRNAILANQAKGMSAGDAAAHAIAGACTAGAAVYKVPPALAGPLCQGVGVVAVKGAQAAAKGALIAGKLTGRGAKAVGKGVGKGAAAVGKGVGKSVKKVFGSFLGLGDVDVYDGGDFEDPHGRVRGAEYYTRHF